MDEILFWRIFLVLGSLGYLGASGLFALKLLAASTGRERIIDLFIHKPIRINDKNLKHKLSIIYQHLNYMFYILSISMEN